ncbi:MAG: hypothetical protein HHJ11_11565 [Phycicoccus sp.]|nr:hypothetical protein [Phycicoccus sp.]
MTEPEQSLGGLPSGNAPTSPNNSGHPAFGAAPEPERAARLPIHGDLLVWLTSQCDIAPMAPLLSVTDATILARMTGCARVVAKADSLHLQQLADG